MTPINRVRAAWVLLLLTVVFAIIDCWLYSQGRLSVQTMMFQTLILSWLAITFTALDIVATTDVRAKEETQ